MGVRMRFRISVLSVVVCAGFVAVAPVSAQTVTWITPPPPISWPGGTFTVEWEVAGFTGALTNNAVAWGVTSLLGQTPNQLTGNGKYSETITVPNWAGPLFYAAYAETATEFANAAPVEVFISPEMGLLQTRLAVLEAAVAAIEANTVLNLDGVVDVGTHNGLPAVQFTGVNVQVLNGTGTTDGPVNGLGNLIVGYDLPNQVPAGLNDKTGSHNLIVGSEHSYASFGGAVFGLRNAGTAGYANVTGGVENTASGFTASVTGGRNNEASGLSSTVTGGGGPNSAFDANLASGAYASVSGGADNTASGDGASVTGGEGNTAGGGAATVTGGLANSAEASWSSVDGGGGNSVTAGAQRGTVSGGLNRNVSGVGNWRGGGLLQTN